MAAIHKVKSTAANRATHDSVQPLILWVAFKKLVIAISILRNELLPHKHQSQHDSYLEDRLSDYVFEHRFIYDVIISVVRHSFE